MDNPTPRFRLIPFEWPTNASHPQKSFNGSDVYFPWWTWIKFNIEGTELAFEFFKDQPKPKITQTYDNPAPITPFWINDLECKIVVTEDKIKPYYCLYDTQWYEQHKLATDKFINTEITGVETTDPSWSRNATYNEMIKLGALRFYYFNRVLKRMAGACEILLKVDVWQSFTWRIIPMVVNDKAWPYMIKRGGMPYLPDMGVNKYSQDPLFDMKQIYPTLIYTHYKPQLKTLGGDNPYKWVGSGSRGSGIGLDGSVVVNGYDYISKVVSDNVYTVDLDIPSGEYNNNIYYVFQWPQNMDMHVYSANWKVAWNKLLSPPENNVFAFPCWYFEKQTIKPANGTVAMGKENGWTVNWKSGNTAVEFAKNLANNNYSASITIKNWTAGTTNDALSKFDPKIAVGQNALEQLKSKFTEQFIGIFIGLNMMLINNYLSWLPYWWIFTADAQSLPKDNLFVYFITGLSGDMYDSKSNYSLMSSDWCYWIAHTFILRRWQEGNSGTLPPIPQKWLEINCATSKTLWFHLIKNQPQRFDKSLTFSSAQNNVFNWVTYEAQVNGGFFNPNGTLEYPLDYFGSGQTPTWNIDPNSQNTEYYYSQDFVADNIPNKYVLSKTALYNEPDFTPFTFERSTLGEGIVNNNWTQNYLRLETPDYYWFDNGFKMAWSKLNKVYAFAGSYPVNTTTYDTFVQNNRASLDTSLQIAKNNKEMALASAITGGLMNFAQGAGMYGMSFMSFMNGLNPMMAVMMGGQGGMSMTKSMADIGLGVAGAINSYRNTELQIQSKLLTAQNTNQSQIISGVDSDTLFNLMLKTSTMGRNWATLSPDNTAKNLSNGLLVHIANGKWAQLFNYISRQYGAYINNTTTNWCFVGGYNDNLGGVDWLAWEGDIPEQVYAQAFHGESYEIQQAFKTFMENPLRIWRGNQPNNPPTTS